MCRWDIKKNSNEYFTKLGFFFNSIIEKNHMKTEQNYTLRSLLGAELHFEVNLAKERKRE